MDGITDTRGPIASIALPRDRILYCFHVVSAFVGLDYWIDSVRYEPALPFAIRALLRPEGDSQYVTLVSALFRNAATEFSSIDAMHSGTLTFPLGSVALHAACVGAFGDAGFVIGDVLAALAYYVVLGAFLRALGLSDIASRSVAIATTTGLTTRAWAWFAGVVPIPPDLELVFWGQRLPRPLVAEPVTVLAMTSVAALVLAPTLADDRRSWAVLGVSLALLAQSDVYAAAAVIPVALLAAAFALARARSVSRARGVRWFVGSLVLGLVPFAYQTLRAHPDVSRRLGVFIVPRLAPPLPPRDWLGRLSLFGALALIVGILARLRGGLGMANRLAAVALLVALVLFGWQAMPLTTIASGKAIQLYHFKTNWLMITSYGFLGAAALALDSVLGWFRNSATIAVHPARALRGPVIAVAVSFASGCSFAEQPHHISMDNPRVFANSHFRADVADLVRALSSTPYERYRVLATFDPVVYEWWVGHQGRSGFVSDPFLSTRPDIEHEARFMAFCDELGVTPDTFRGIVQGSANQIFWLSHDKYDASSLHHFGALTDYPPQAKSQIVARKFMDGWNIVVPISEVDRLATAYAQGAWKMYRFTAPDIVILRTSEVSADRHPHETSFRETFSNTSFKVWVRRTP